MELPLPASTLPQLRPPRRTTSNTATHTLDGVGLNACYQPSALTLLYIERSSKLRGHVSHKGPILHTEQAHTEIAGVRHHKARAVTCESQAIRTAQLPICTAWTIEATSQHA
jgi:hypothetical protein